MKILRYVHSIGNERLNVKAYSRQSGIPRPTIKYNLKLLIEKGLIYQPHEYDHKLTQKGEAFLGVIGGVKNLRRECQDSANLSTHYHKFKLPIISKEKFLKERIRDLDPIGQAENKLRNLHQYIIYFEDATVMINPKQLIINLFDSVGSTVEEVDLESITKASEYAMKLEKIGIITDTMMLEEGHWARVESLLAEFLEKIDSRYFLDLGNGKKFWIDHSVKLEDETNDKDVRERIDNFFSDVIESDALISDIDKIIKALGLITKIECARFKSQIIPIHDQKPDYFG